MGVSDKLHLIQELKLHLTAAQWLERDNARQARMDAAGLTPRQKEVAECIALGMSNKQIGQKLFITEATAKDHTSHLFAKLGVSSRAHAIAVLNGN